MEMGYFPVPPIAKYCSSMLKTLKVFYSTSSFDPNCSTSFGSLAKSLSDHQGIHFSTTVL